MARIQILPLPVERVGDGTTTPFVIVIDQAQAEDLTHLLDVSDHDRLAALKAGVGAHYVLLTMATLDVA